MSSKAKAFLLGAYGLVFFAFVVAISASYGGAVEIANSSVIVTILMGCCMALVSIGLVLDTNEHTKILNDNLSSLAAAIKELRQAVSELENKDI